MIEIDVLVWLLVALLICGWHALHIRSWRRERRRHMLWWRKYDANARTRHDELMQALQALQALQAPQTADGDVEKEGPP